MRHAPIEITRAKIEAKIEELIALLDHLDGDENLSRIWPIPTRSTTTGKTTTNASPKKPMRTAMSKIAAAPRMNGHPPAAIWTLMAPA